MVKPLFCIDMEFPIRKMLCRSIFLIYVIGTAISTVCSITGQKFTVTKLLVDKFLKQCPLRNEHVLEFDVFELEFVPYTYLCLSYPKFV